MAGHDLVIAIIGTWPKPEDLKTTAYSDVAKAYIPAMQQNGLTRFFTVLGAGFLGDKIPEDW